MLASERVNELQGPTKLKILKEEVGKGFQQLVESKTSDKTALDIFAEVSRDMDGKLSQLAV